MNIKDAIPISATDFSAVAASDVVRVQLGSRAYDIVVQSGVVDRVGQYVAEWTTQRFGARPRRCLIVSDQHVAPHAARVQHSLIDAGFDARVTHLPPGEESKCQQVINGLYDQLVDLQADRRTVVVAVGGGVVGDAAGFAAASFNRGLPFVQVPTTLLADVDSSVGGKVGINHPRAKNLIGAFHQPLGVLIDPDLLKTLPSRDLCSGFAEVVKYGVILDQDFFVWLEEHRQELKQRDPASLRVAIARSCRLKADVVEKDEYETTGLRAVLNYGHTFAHAFEALAGYGELLHGEAVSIGMACASRLAEKLGRIDSSVTARQLSLLMDLELPIHLPETGTMTQQQIIDRMKLDKKTLGGNLRFVLPSRLGHVELVDGVPEQLVREVLDEFGIPNS